MNVNTNQQNSQYPQYQTHPDDPSCSKPLHGPSQHAPTAQLFAGHKGMKVCLKRPDGSMVEQTHLKVSHTKDGKFVINTNGQPNQQWLTGGGTAIRAILIDNKQQLGTTSVELPPGTRLVSPRPQLHMAPLQMVDRNAAPMGHMSGPRMVGGKPQHDGHHDRGRQSTPQNGKAKPARQPVAPPQYTHAKHARQQTPQLPSVRLMSAVRQQAPTVRPVSYSPVNGISRQDSGEMYMQQKQRTVQYRAPQPPSTPTHNPPQWNNNSVLNGISSIGPGTRKRYQASPVQHDMKPTPTTSDRKRPRRSSERGGKGLRHFSSKVCEKVKSKGVTTYLEVSEELVQEFSSNLLVNTPSCNSFDVKNIRRRVYDALNVLCAMNIISKDKKEIRWIGLPTNSLQECRALENQKMEMQQRIKEKKKRAQEFMLQLIAYRTLIQRNREMEEKTGPLPENAAIQVPFIILSTGPNTQIGLEVADDKTEYEFTFNEIFEIHDEIAILKKMGFCYGMDTGEFSEEGLAKAESLLPKSAKPFLKELFPRKHDSSVHDGQCNFATAPSDSDKPLEIVEHPQQIKHEAVKLEPQELTDVQKQALKTYSFDAPTYSSVSSACMVKCSEKNFGRGGPAAPEGSSKARETAAANTLLSLTSSNNQGG